MNDQISKPKILIVDDKYENLFAMKLLLGQLEEVVEVIQTTSGFEALSLSLEHDFCLAIVDVQMPEMDGYELVELVRGNQSTANLPIIFVSAIFSDDYHHRKGYDAGAVDFLSKPFVPEILLSKVKVFLALYAQRIKLDQLARQNAQLYELEKELRCIEEKRTAELAELNASKDKFFSIVSHDLRTPFNGLIGHSQLLLMELEEPSGANLVELAESIYDSAQNGYRLLDNLLMWALIQRGVMEPQPEPFTLDSVVQCAVDLLKDSAVQKQISLANNVRAGLMVYADINMVQTVLRNLISNAIKFTPRGGKIIISAQQMPKIGQDCKHDCVELSVSDTGVGILEAEIEKIFQIDTCHSTEGTAKEQGSGLGMILCQEMVSSFGGEIWIESKPGQGTKVTFTMPVEPLTVPLEAL